MKIQKRDPNFFLKHKNLYLSENIKDFHDALDDIFNDQTMTDILATLNILLSKIKNAKRVYNRRKIYDIRRITQKMLLIMQIMDERTALVRKMTYASPIIRVKKYKSSPKKKKFNVKYNIPEELKHLFP